MSRASKLTSFSLFLILISLVFAISTFADSPQNDIMEQISDEIQYFKNSLPKEIIDFMPQEIWSGDFSQLLGNSFGEINLLELVLSY